MNHNCNEGKGGSMEHESKNMGHKAPPRITADKKDDGGGIRKEKDMTKAKKVPY